MTEQTENLILEILKKIQADAHSFRSKANERFERLEELMRKQRHDMAGILVVGKSTAGTFAEDIADVKHGLDALEVREM